MSSVTKSKGLLGVSADVMHGIVGQLLSAHEQAALKGVNEQFGSDLPTIKVFDITRTYCTCPSKPGAEPENLNPCDHYTLQFNDFFGEINKQNPYEYEPNLHKYGQHPEIKLMKAMRDFTLESKNLRNTHIVIKGDFPTSPFPRIDEFWKFIGLRLHGFWRLTLFPAHSDPRDTLSLSYSKSFPVHPPPPPPRDSRTT